MSLNTIFLVCAALIPAVVLCVYVYIKDRVEKEPVSLLLGLLVLGAAICIPAAKLETIIFDVIENFFLPFCKEVNGVYVLGSGLFHVYNVAKNFIGVALVEEGLKFIVMYFVTRNNKNFNSLFDGIIYAVFVSLGFAAFENVFYVLDYGFSNALLRAVTAVPGHMFDGVIMGYYYSMWNVNKQARDQEVAMKNAGYIAKSAKEFPSSKFLALSFVVPVLAHGFYDYCCTIDTSWSTIVFYIFLTLLYVYCFGKIRKMSKLDINNTTYALTMLFNKYPTLVPVYQEMLERYERSQNQNKI